MRLLRSRVNREWQRRSRTGRSSSPENIGVEWQRDFFDHRLRDHHELEEKASYILINPVRKGLCERAEDWMWVYRPTTARRRAGRAGSPAARRFRRRTARTGVRALPKTALTE